MDMLIKRVCIFFPVMLLACHSLEKPTIRKHVYNVTELNLLCAEDIAYHGCESLDEKNINLEGRLFTDVYNHPTVFPLKTAESDFAKEDWPEGINLLVNSKEAEELQWLNGELVTVSGKLSTKCALQYRDARIREKTLNANRNDEDEVVIVMLTGTCHYVGRYINDPKVEKTLQQAES